MNKSVLSIPTLGVLLAFGSSLAIAAAPDWSKIPKRDIAVFHAGVSTYEWVSNKSDHSGSVGLKKGESCAGCHEEKGKLNFDFKRLASKELEPVGAPRTMQFPVAVPGADPKKKKYVKDANVAGGVYMDYFQWKSGEAGQGATQLDGHVAQERINKGGQALVKAEGENKGNEYTVTFTRKLSGGEGDIALADGQVVPFGIAIHADKTIHRYHHVSLGYTLGLGANADVKAMKQ